MEEDGGPRKDELEQGLAQPSQPLQDHNEIMSDSEDASSRAGSSAPPESNDELTQSSSDHSRLGKRKRDSSVGLGERWYKRKMRANPFYIEMLNDCIAEANAPSSDIRRNSSFYIPGTDSQFGLIDWPFPEKKQLYSLLSRDRWRESHVLPSTMTPRSDFEIIHVTQQLDKRVESLYEEDRPFIASAAVDVSDSCVEALEKEALKLVRLQQDADADREEERFGYYAILTHDLVKELEFALGHLVVPTGVTPVQPDHKVTELAQFFNLESWLDLSEQFFMHKVLNNKSAMAQNADSSFERPALFATAVGDFYNLVVSVTRRLVSAAIFQAVSRLRTVPDGHWDDDVHDQHHGLRKRRQPSVALADVHAALDMLSMDYNTVSYWRHAPRRLGVEVYKHGIPKVFTVDFVNYRYLEYDELMNYDEVEKGLHIPFERRWDSPEPESDYLSENDSEGFEEVLHTQVASHQPQSNSSERQSRCNEAEEEQIQQEEREDNEQQEVEEEEEDEQDENEEDEAIIGDDDAKLEAADVLASTEAEALIWEALQHQYTSTKHVLGYDPQSVRDTGVLSIGRANAWKENVDFRSEWERYGYCLNEDAFSARRGVSKPAGVGFRRRSKAHKQWIKESRNSSAARSEKGNAGVGTKTDTEATDDASAYLEDMDVDGPMDSGSNAASHAEASPEIGSEHESTRG